MSFLKSLRNSRRHSGLSDISNVDKRETSTVIQISGRSKNKTSGILKNQPEQHEGLQRSDTFTIQDKNGAKSHKASVFDKFSTFTRKMKSPPMNGSAVEAKSDGLYKRWPNPSDPTIIVEDPFDVLYTGQRSTSPSNTKNSTVRPSVVDGGTYRKSKGLSQARESIVDMRFDDDAKNNGDDNEQDKFRTVTFNSYRKSFRKKFLTNTNDVPYNPSWFVEIEPAPKSKSTPLMHQDMDDESKTKSLNLLFENETYRPTARSPSRHEAEFIAKRHSGEYVYLNKSASSPLKRADTFKIELDSSEPTFRIEIKNSITKEPGRMIPVGVAKPMPSSDGIANSPASSPEKDPSHLHRTRIHINGPSRSEGKRSEKIRSPVRFESRGRSRQRLSPIGSNDPPLSDYSPLKSYEMLSQLRNPNSRIHSDPVCVGRVETCKRDKMPTYSRGRNTTALQIHANELRTKPVSSSNKQIHIFLEHAVRKEPINMHRYSANIRKQAAKAPWR